MLETAKDVDKKMTCEPGLRWGATSWVRKYGPLTLRAMVLSNDNSLVCSKSCMGRTAALRMRMSIPP